MKKYILLDDLVAEIKRRINVINLDSIEDWRYRLQREHDIEVMKDILSLIDTLEVIDPYEQCIQYTDRESAIKAHAEDYSWNIESELFQQLTPEQQKLWRKEIEQACISGGYCGLNLARDPRYKENLEVKEVDLDSQIEDYINSHFTEGCDGGMISDWYKVLGGVHYKDLVEIAKHFFELGLKAQKGEEV